MERAQARRPDLATDPECVVLILQLPCDLLAAEACNLPEPQSSSKDWPSRYTRLCVPAHDVRGGNGNAAAPILSFILQKGETGRQDRHSGDSRGRDPSLLRGARLEAFAVCCPLVLYE
eukprot:6469742-Amphidinium_carterae.1